MYLPDFLDGFDRLAAFDAETTGKRTPDAEFIHKQPFAWKALASSSKSSAHTAVVLQERSEWSNRLFVDRRARTSAQDGRGDEIHE
jgi:hypothetical protein